MEDTLNQIAELWSDKSSHSFLELSNAIVATHHSAQGVALKAVNQMATLRNWLIGCYIVEYEQQGSDRAKYGDHLLQSLEESVNTKGLNLTLFKVSRKFYLLYPQIGELLNLPFRPTASDKLEKESMGKGAMASHQLEKGGGGQKSATASHQFVTAATEIIGKLSFSHIREIMTQDDPLARFFYETECIKGTWSVKELRSQISTNLYFRSGVSKDPAKLLSTLNPEKNSPALSIRQPFAFEFLGLDAKDMVTEGDLEDALISHLQDFLLEMGKGFCFEDRQKRMIIDGEYYFADLVFYNRLLHCNVIIELKNDEFRHEYLGQLNAYVSYYRENEMHPGDNPPVGILLCTRKGKKMVEYAIAGMDNQLFVSTYMLQLPDTTTLENFLLKEIKENGEK